MSTLNTHTRYLHRGIVDYSERLLATMPDYAAQYPQGVTRKVWPMELVEGESDAFTLPA